MKLFTKTLKCLLVLVLFTSIITYKVSAQNYDASIELNQETTETTQEETNEITEETVEVVQEEPDEIFEENNIDTDIEVIDNDIVDDNQDDKIENKDDEHVSIDEKEGDDNQDSFNGDENIDDSNEIDEYNDDYKNEDELVPADDRVDDGIVYETMASTISVPLTVTYGQTEGRRMLSMINQFRTSTTENWQYDEYNQVIWINGLGTLSYDYKLEELAMVRAAEIAVRWSHDHPDGLDSDTWIGNIIRTYNYYTMGENLAFGQETAESAMDAWKETDQPFSGQGHRRNMQTREFNSVGIGHAVYNGVHYWVQLFGGRVYNSSYVSPNDSNKTLYINIANNFISGINVELDSDEIEVNRGSSANLPTAKSYLTFISGFENNLHEYWKNLRHIYNPSQNITWSSNNTSIATVSGTRVTGVSKGNTTVKASASYNGYSANANVNVKVLQPVIGVTLNKSSLTLAVYASEDLVATVSPSNASNTDVIWSSSNTDVATVYNGRVNAKKPGTATITVKTVDGNKTATCIVTVIRPVSSVSINPSNKTIAIGETHTISPSINPNDATNPVISYSSSDSTIASVTSGGVVTGKKVGTATITVTVKSADNSIITKTVAITVGKAIESISLNRTEARVKEGTALGLSVTYNPSDAVNKSVTWSTNNSSVATVSASGTVTTVSPGSATITATTPNGKKATCLLTVYKALSSISVSPSSATIASGNTKQLTVSYYPSNAGNKEVTWKSSNSNVATVDANGLVTAVNGGTATITVTSKESSSITATCTIYVTQMPTSVSLNKTTLILNEIGSSETLIATVKPTTATNKNITWTSNDTSIATVNSNGLVTAKKYGSTTVTARTANGYTATCTVRVGVAPDSVSLNKTSAYIKIGDNETLIATVSPSNSHTKEIVWTSSNTNVATVDSNGKITAIAKGTATITATCFYSYSARCYVTVAQPVTSITASDVEVAKGKTVTVSYEALPADANNKTVNYSIDDTSIATVNTYGQVTGVSVGTTYLTLTAKDGYGAQKRVAVNVKQAAESISLNKTSLTIVSGASERLIATVLPENAFDKSIVWTSSANSVATVDENGLVTGVSIGSARITARNPLTNKSATCYVYVRQPVESITLNKTIVDLAVGNIVNLTATVSPSNAYNPSYEWISSNSSVATVDTNGKVTAISKGIANITARALDGSNVTAICTINVIQHVTSITLNKTTLTLNKGNSETLTYTVKPDNASNKEVTWRSMNNNIATVDENGKITAVDGGKVTIIATAKDGSGVKAMCDVTVNVLISKISVQEPLFIDKWKSESFTLTVEIEPENATNKKLEYVSSNTDVITVDENGIFTCVKEGTASIYVRSTDGSNKSVQRVVDVYQGVEEIILDKTSLFLMEGESYTFNPTILPKNISATLAWSSSDATVVSVNYGGKITANKPGVVTIKTSSILGPKVEATCVVTVGTRVKDIIVSELSKNLDIGQTYKFNASVSPDDATNKVLQWYSSDDTIATVDDQGNVTAHSRGDVIIYVKTTDGSEIEKEINVKVLQKPESVSLDKTTLELVKDTTDTLIATILPQDTDDKSLTWSSSNTNVATVDQNGKITAKNKGTATITVKTSNNKTATCVVTVIVKVSGVSLKSSTTLGVGDSEKLTPTISPSNANNKNVSWSSSNSSTVSVDSNGNIKGLKKGTATITVTTEDGQHTASCEVTVNQQAESVSLNITTLELLKDSTETLIATVLPQDANNKNLTWSSSNANIATVDQNGKITAKKGGVVTITAKTTNNKSATCKVTVIVKATGISLSKEEITLNIGEEEKLSVIFEPIDTTNKNVIWRSNIPDVVSVDDDGNITAHKKGNASIMAMSEDGRHIKFCFVTVDNLPTSLSLNKSNITLYVNDTESLIATVLPQDAEDKSLTWSSSNNNIVTVDKNGKITAKAEGTATITVKTVNNKTATCKVTVKQPETTYLDVNYRTHVQSYGWQSYVSNGDMSGTSGKAKRLEGINIYLSDTKGYDVGIKYTTHCQSYGWLPWVKDGDMSGTSGESKRLESIKIELTGSNSDKFDVYYRVHAQTYGWLSWAKNGEEAGTAGLSKRLEGIQIIVLSKDSPAPSKTYKGITSKRNEAFIGGASSKKSVITPGQTYPVYRSYVQSKGWMENKHNGMMSGTTGRSLRLEAIKIGLENKTHSGNVTYRTYDQSAGWQKWTSNGQISGTVGENKSIEAIQIKLTGELANQYDIYYRLQVQSYGWLAWAKNGETSGTIDLSKRVESIQIIMVKKGANPPSNSHGGYGMKTNSTYIQ